MYKQLLLILFFSSVLIGCKKMDDIYRGFYEKGETVYVGKADSLKVRGGNKRVELSWLLLSDPKVNSYKIYWNNRRDSIENTVVKSANVDTVRVILDNMPEDVYLFEVFTFDKNKNSSILSSTVGRSYGNYYQSFILNRTFKSSKRITAGAEITWNAAAQDLIFQELNYSDNKGNAVKKFIPRTSDKDTLFNIPVKGVFTYRSAYLPEANALDTFYTPYKTYTLAN